MKLLKIVSAVAVVVFFISYTYSTPQEGEMLGGGSGTINQLEQWKKSGGYITQNVSGAILKLTGYESNGNCLVTDINGVVSTTTCGTGTGGGGGAPIYIQTDGATQSSGATTTLNFTSNSFSLTENPADTFSIRVSTTTLGLLASSISDFVATVRSSITESVTGLTFTTGNLTLDSGYTIPSTTRAILWDNASGTVTSVAMTVPTGFSIAGTPITSAGTLALTYGAGYEGFLTASGTAWTNFYNTPSNRITAGTGIDWSANTLNTVLTAGDGLTLTVEDFDCDIASGSIFGCLSTTDWTSFNNKVSSTSIDTSAELATLVTDETGVGSLVFSGSPVFTGGAQFAGIRASASSTLGYASSTALTVSGQTYLANASSTSFTSSDNAWLTYASSTGLTSTRGYFTNATSSTSFFSALGTFTNLFGTTGVFTSYTATNGTTTNATSTTSFFSGLGRFTNSIISGVLRFIGSANPTVDEAGEVAYNTTSQSLSFATTTSGGGELPFYPPVSIIVASSSWTGTSTENSWVTLPNYSETILTGNCYANTGAKLVVGNGTSSTTPLTLGAGTSSVSVNQKFNNGGTRVIFAIGSVTAGNTVASCKFERLYAR